MSSWALNSCWAHATIHSWINKSREYLNVRLIAIFYFGDLTQIVNRKINRTFQNLSEQFLRFCNEARYFFTQVIIRLTPPKEMRNLFFFILLNFSEANFFKWKSLIRFDNDDRWVMEHKYFDFFKLSFRQLTITVQSLAHALSQWSLSNMMTLPVFSWP